MLTMDTIKDIRFRFYVKGEKISQVTAFIELDWKTVQKYVDMNNFNEPSPKRLQTLLLKRIPTSQ